MSKPSQSPISDELLDSLFKNYEKPEDFFGNSGIIEQLTKHVIERAVRVELAHHLGHAKHGTVSNRDGNTRNVAEKRSRASTETLKSTSHAPSRGSSG